MQQIIVSFMLLFLGLWIVGCNSESVVQVANIADDVEPSTNESNDLPSITPIKITESTNSLIPTPMPSLTPYPTHTIMPTKLPFLTSTPTPTIVSVQELCGAIEHFDPGEVIGVKIVEGIVAEWKGDEGTSIVIQGENVDAPAFVEMTPTGAWTTNISPDGNWLAYTEATELDEAGNAIALKVTVLNPNSGVAFHTLIQNEFVPQLHLSGFRWLNNNQLIIHTLPESGSPTITYIFWSPFTGNTEELVVELSGYEHIVYAGTVYPIIDPQLEYIVYPCYNAAVCGDKDFRVQDILSGQEAWATESMTSPYAFPRYVQWSPDSIF